MSDIEGERVEEPSQNIPSTPVDNKTLGSQLLEIDTEPVLPFSLQAELQSSCDTYMSQESNNGERQEILEAEVLTQGGELNQSSLINSSLEVEVDHSDHDHNVTLATALGTKEDSQPLAQVLENSQDDSFQEAVSVKEANNSTSPRLSRKRKGRCDNSSPSSKKSKRENISPKTSQGRPSIEVIYEEQGVKKEEETVLGRLSTAENIIISDDSQEFSLKIDTTPPSSQRIECITKDSHESDTWKSHSRDKNPSPGSGSLSQKSLVLWSSHNHNDQSLSWSSHKSMEDKYSALKKENEELSEELERLRRRSLSPENTKAKHCNWNAQVDGEAQVRTVTDERLVHCIIKWNVDEKTNKVLLAEVKQMSLVEETPREKPNRLSISSHKSSSSSGSVGLPGPFPLPGFSRLSIMSSVSTSTTSSSGTHPGWDGPFLKPPVPGSKALVALSCGLCSKLYPPVERPTSPIMNGSPKLSEEEELKIKPATPRRARKGTDVSSTQSSGTLEEETGTSSSGSKPQAASTPTPIKPRGRPKKNPLNNLQKTPKNEVAKPVKTKTATPTPRTPAKTKPKGEAVFARWADSRYYPGFVSPAPRRSQTLVHFCDGKNKLTAPSKVVRADIITAGTLVLADTNTGEYEEVLVIEVDTTGPEPQYLIERDSVTRNVPFSCIALLETQITELTMTDAQKAAASLNFNDLSLENILSHPRKRAARLPFGEDSPSSPSMKKKKRQVTPEPSTSHGQTFGGPDEDTDSSTQSICSLNLRGKEMRPLDVECSPPEVQDQNSRVKLSHYRRNMTFKTKKREDEPEYLVREMGPIPEAGSEIFAGCAFLITYTTEIELKTFGDMKFSSFEDGSDIEGPVLLWKERLRTQIKTGGGKVYTSLSHLTKEELLHTYLITDKPCNTPLYLQCLVHDIPIYSITVIHKCCAQNRPFKELIALRTTKKLPAGYSLAKKSLVNPRNTQPLRGKTLLLALSGEPALNTYWKSLVRMLGGSSEIYNGGWLVEQRFDIIVTDPDCDQDLVSQACDQEVPLVSSIWLQQCIINGDFRSPTEHPLYKYNCSPGQGSPEY